MCKYSAHNCCLYSVAFLKIYSYSYKKWPSPKQKSTHTDLKITMSKIINHKPIEFSQNSLLP